MAAIAATLFLALLSTSAAQSSTSASDSAAASESVNSALPQTAATGPYGFVVPSLTAITSGASSDSTVPLASTFAAGATGTVTGAPTIPTSPSSSNYPELDKVPPVNSTEVQQWVSQINWGLVPNYTATTGDCSTSSSATSDGRCWWTCGGCTRETDITTCPDQLTWGVSYDDGPSPYTPLLLDYLNEVNLTSTFFLVGSRVISYPEIVVSEYMTGHQLSVHTWSHPYLTTLTNEEIVAELGWTQKVIRDVVGVTPNTFRPPYGDIDDRVRAIAAQMGLTPILWTGVTVNGTTTSFDTLDYNIPGNLATGESSLTKFEQILETYVPLISTGFIVLEHDLYQQTVDLAVGYFLPIAIASGKYTLKSIVSCLGLPNSEAYIETSSNNTATVITSPKGTGTIFQASIGTATGAAVTPSSSASSSASAAVSSDAAVSASASASTSKASGAERHATIAAALPAAVALFVVAASIVIAA